MNVAPVVFGQLTGIECRRALGRGWLVVVRTLVAVALALLLLFLYWIWWVTLEFAPLAGPPTVLKYALSIAALALLVIAVVQAPAVLAGSLAGERERGVIQLLLTTAATPRDIVLGRLLGKLSQVAMLVLAAVPALALLFAWNGLALAQLVMLFLLLAAVGLGGGGLAIGASVVSRRGRDALLSVYILILALVLSPLLSWVGLPAPIAEWLLWFNPFYSMNRLVFDGALAPALATSAAWLGMGTLGVIVAAWRLRPACLAVGTVVKKARRRRPVPAVGEAPMLWKELYVERVGTLGRFGRWMGILITAAIGGGSLALAALIAVELIRQRETDWTSWATSGLQVMLTGASGTFMGWLLQWAVGLRAAVAIASERERGTWDALLMSPLEPSEIVRAKVFGSLHALRYMVAAMVVAWTLAVITGAVSVGVYATWIVGNLLMAALMAAVGVRLSLSLPTATRAMTWTIAMWLAGMAGIAAIAGCLIGLGWMSITAFWMVRVHYGFIAPNTLPSSPITVETAWIIAWDLVTLVVTILIVVDTSVRFDRIAGRMAGGALAVSVDQFLHGQTHQPVFLPAKTKKRPAEKPKTPEQELPVPVRAVDIMAAD